MRRSIFKDEFYFALSKFDMKQPEQESLVRLLFENPHDSPRQFILKDDHTDWNNLEAKIQQLCTHKDMLPVIRRLFIIEEDFEIIPQLRKQILQSEPIAVFVGAGISRILKYPSWENLADKSIEYLLDKKHINYFDQSRINREISNPKEKLTIFHEIISPRESHHFYKNLLISHRDMGSDNPYNTLVKFDWIKITTNFDTEFYNALKNQNENCHPPIISNFNEDTNINYDTIYQIHGSIADIENAVITTKNYIDKYYKEESGLRSFLQNIFKNFTVIFLGYGLQELEILESVTQNKAKHFAFIGTYLNEQSFIHIKRKYLDTINITPIPFYLDFNKYDRQIDILKKWYDEIVSIKSKNHYEIKKKIDRVI
jgi:NAD-dependent SIR2 family protein deacetylase